MSDQTLRAQLLSIAEVLHAQGNADAYVLMAAADRLAALEQEIHDWQALHARRTEEWDARLAKSTARAETAEVVVASLEQRDGDPHALANRLREAATVLDEPFHRDAVASTLGEAADALERSALEHQETRGTVAAWKQEAAKLESLLASRDHPTPVEENQKREEQTYPCEDCGVPRTKAQGGTVFTVCEACWDKHYKRDHPTPEEPDPPHAREDYREVWASGWRAGRAARSGEQD